MGHFCRSSLQVIPQFNITLPRITRESCHTRILEMDGMTSLPVAEPFWPVDVTSEGCADW